VEIEPAWEALGMGRGEYEELLRGLPFGRKYLLPKKKLAALAQRRHELIEGKAEAKAAKEKGAEREPLAVSRSGTLEEGLSASEHRDKRRHRYLQSLIKRMAEERGYRAVIEQPTPDGLGRVDVSLERDGRKIACEISVTSTDEQELSNIEKCLVAGYEEVICCAPQKKTLSKIKSLVWRRLKRSERAKVIFCTPDEIAPLLEEAGRGGRYEKPAGFPGEAPGLIPEDRWQERIWYALRHLDDRSALNQSPLARLAYIQRLAETRYRGTILARGSALKEVLLGCVDRVLALTGEEQGLQTTCEFLRLVKEGLSLTAISERLGLSREHVSRVYRRRAVELVAQEFLRVARRRKRKSP